MIDNYTASDGTLHAIDSMAYPHLRAATAKLTSLITDQPHRLDELAAMKVELARRDEKFKADVARLKAEGWSVWQAPMAFATDPVRFHVSGPRAPSDVLNIASSHKTADAAWWAAIKEAGL